MIRQNLTEKNKEKIFEILQHTIKPTDEVLIVKDEIENINNIQDVIKDNMQFNYLIEATDSTKNSKQFQEAVKDYIEKNLINNLEQFLKEKGYKLDKAPITKIQIKDNMVAFGFLNLMEVNGKKAIMTDLMRMEFEDFILDKLNMFFGITEEVIDEEQAQEQEEKREAVLKKIEEIKQKGNIDIELVDEEEISELLKEIEKIENGVNEFNEKAEKLKAELEAELELN